MAQAGILFEVRKAVKRCRSSHPPDASALQSLIIMPRRQGGVQKVRTPLRKKKLIVGKEILDTPNDSQPRTGVVDDKPEGGPEIEELIKMMQALTLRDDVE